jgi:c-di-GMP-binding flagellar brake protein YcgR
MAAISVKIDRATVRRVEHESKKQQFRYAFEFMKLDREEQQKLQRFIYHVHRQQLQRR